jgi:hypothetical protein
MAYALTRQNNVALQHDVITTFCLIILIEKLVLRVKRTKQHEVTTRRYDNVLFDYFD